MKIEPNDYKLCKPDGPRERHLKAFYLTVEVFLDVMISGKFIGCPNSNYPPDSRYVSCHYDFNTDAMRILMEHPTFPLTPQGQQALIEPLQIEVKHED
jgi:hypothetical protein